jgi:hypothetical protein
MEGVPWRGPLEGVPWRDSHGGDPNADAEADLIKKFADSMRIIPCPEVTVVDVEHTLTRKMRSICPHNVE